MSEVIMVPDNNQRNNSGFDPNLLFASMMNGGGFGGNGNPSTGVVEKLIPISKETIDSLLKSYKIEIKENQLHDYVYVANMCKADFLGSSIPDEQHLCKYVKDVIDDIDAYDGIVFNRWYADMCRKGIAIDWYEML